MATGPDLAKLHIDREEPAAGVKRAFKRTAWLAGAAIVVVLVFVLMQIGRAHV